MFRSRVVFACVLTAMLAVGVLLPVPAWAEEKSPAPAVENALNSVTVFPVVCKPQTDLVVDLPKRVAAVVGLFLEKAGVEDVALAEAAFESPDTDDVDQIAAEFAKLVREKPPKTQYALYAEILVAPKTGPKEIRTILVDRQGKVLLAARDDEKTYTRTSDTRPKDPMTCSLFVAQKIRKHANLADPLRRDAPQGKMAAYWRQQSGLPPQEEFAAMEERAGQMMKNLKTSKFAVHPVRIGDGTDKQCAAQLAEMLTRQKLCQAVLSDVDPKLKIQNDPNQQKVLWSAARAFREFVRKNPPEVDYAVFADYGIGRSPSGEAKVRYVHVIVCDRAGDWVLVDLQNSHHGDFQAIGPKTAEDCNRLLVRRAQGLIAGQLR